MRNAQKLGLVFALGGLAAFAGCSSSGTDQVDNTAGSSNAGAPAGGHAGTGQAGAAHAGAATGGGGSGSAGAPAAGAGGATAGAGGATAGAGGAAAGAGGATAGAGGATAGAGGATAGAGGATAGAGGATAGAGGATAGAGGASGGASGGGAGGATAGAGGTGGFVTCADESTGLPAAAGSGSGGAPGASTAIVLLDNVVVKKAAATLIQWQFADATAISNTSATDAPPADKWARSAYGYTVSGNAGASDAFLACAGNPTGGSLKNIAPFTAADQQYEVRVAGAPLDLSGATLTAKIKLVAGGKPDANCPVRATLYAINNVGGTNTDPSAVTLKVGQWVDASLTVPGTGFTAAGLVGLRLNTFACN